MKTLLAILVSVMAFCAVFAAFRLGAQSIPIVINKQLSNFGMVGLEAGQTALLNACALSQRGPIIAGGCQVTFTFYDDQGNSLKSTTLPVVPGQAVHYDLSGTATITSVPPAPQEIRGTVRTNFTPPTTTPGPAIGGFCSVLPTMEIFNSAGQVTAVLELSHGLPTVVPL